MISSLSDPRALHGRRIVAACIYNIIELKLMQPNRGLTELLMCLERILENAFPGESGAARLQQVALFTLIYLLQRHGKPATASQLAEMSGQATANMGKHLKKLMDLDLIERTAIRNKQGRGHAYELTVRKNGKTKPLTKAIEKGARSRK